MKLMGLIWVYKVDEVYGVYNARIINSINSINSINLINPYQPQSTFISKEYNFCTLPAAIRSGVRANRKAGLSTTSAAPLERR